MAKAVELLPAALAEAEGAAAWYAERSPNAAALFAAALTSELQRIAAHPDIWPAHLQGTRRAVLGRFPFLIVYRVEPTRILVVAVAHARREPGYWRRRGG